MFYVPSKPWTIVLPVIHILGKVPLMKVYLGDSSAATIPHSFAGWKQRYFKRGSTVRAAKRLATHLSDGAQLGELSQMAHSSASGAGSSMSAAGCQGRMIF